MDDWELRETVIDRFDIYDLVEILDLTTEDLIDTWDILSDPSLRTKIIERIEG